jgi:hypothetical protein
MPKTTTEKQTANKRPDGKFAPGNKLGNRFAPGETGNRNGRPKLTVLGDALRAQLAVEMPDASERTYAEEIARVLCEEAARGNVAAAREIADRAEGKPKQAIDVDIKVTDWREMARTHGLSESDVIDEARRLIAESATDSSDAPAD